MQKCISVGHHWNFRRSAGQSGAINILYGILSGSLAILTEGVVFSDDSAWDYNKMPIEGERFLENYFRPAKETDPETRRKAIDSIKWAKEELAAKAT